MDAFRFYYDESEHSQKITKATFDAANYYDGFVAVSVGWKVSDEELIERRYANFETSYKKRMSGGELKSTTIKFSELKHGFASMRYLQKCMESISMAAFVKNWVNTLSECTQSYRLIL